MTPGRAGKMTCHPKDGCCVAAQISLSILFRNPNAFPALSHHNIVATRHEYKAEPQRTPQMNQLSMFELSGFGGLLILALDLWAIISVFGSNASTGKKVLWTLLILFLPIIGFIAWFFLGPRAAQRSI